MQQKLMIGGGIVILFLIMMTCSFALGVYVGRYGLTREGLTLQRPGDRQRSIQVPPDQQPGQGFQGQQLPGEPTLVGRIRRMGRNALDLATQDGPRRIIVDDETQIRDQSGEEVSPDSLEVGTLVSVFGAFEGDGRELRADLVIVLPNDLPPK